jgi:hypothetical protein
MVSQKLCFRESFEKYFNNFKRLFFWFSFSGLFAKPSKLGPTKAGRQALNEAIGLMASIRPAAGSSPLSPNRIRPARQEAAYPLTKK